MQTGDRPDSFSLPSTTGGDWSLQATLQSGKSSILAFFPAAFTGGWIAELTSWRRYQPEIQAAGGELVAISTDTVFALRVFAAALGGFPFPLLGDRAQAVSRTFGVLDPERGNARRSTFVIGPDGRVTFANPAFSASDPSHYEAVVAHLKGEAIG